MRYALPALILCLLCARVEPDSLLPRMLYPAYWDCVQRPGEMYGFWLWTGPDSIRDQVGRTGANAASMHLMMRLEPDAEAPDGLRIVPRAIEDPFLDGLVGAGVGLGEHNNPFFVRYPDWFWDLRQEARMKDRDGKTIRAGANRVPAMLDPLLVRLAKEQMAAMVGSLADEPWVRYWVIGGEQSWPDYFGLPEGDHSPAVRRHFAAWKRLRGRGDADWRAFRDSVVADRYAGYTAHLHKIDPTRPAMLPTHGNPFVMDLRSKLGYPLNDLAGVVDGFEAGPISIDDDAERIIRMTLDQQTSFGVPVVAPRLANKQLDASAKGGGRGFNPSSLRRTVYEALGLGVWHLGLVHWIGDLHDGEWAIAGKPAEAEAKRVFEELRRAGPYLDGCSRLRPAVGIFISDATWSRWWQDRWTLLYDEAIRRGWSVVLITDVQIDTRLASETPVLVSVDNSVVTEATRNRLEEYERAGGRVISAPDVPDGPAVKIIHQTQTSTGANTWSFDVKPLDLDAVEAVAGADLRPVTVLESGKRAEGIEPYLLTDGTNVQVVLINRTDRVRSVRLVCDSARQVRDLLTGELLPSGIAVKPLGTALVSLEPPVSLEDVRAEAAVAEAAVARWKALGAETAFHQTILDRMQEHLKADRPSKAHALARTITRGLAFRATVDGSSGLKVTTRVWRADGIPATNAEVRARLIPGRFEWVDFREAAPGVYQLDLSKERLPLFYNPSSGNYELVNGATQVVLDVRSGECRGGLRETVVLK